MFAANDNGKNDGPLQGSGYQCHPDSNPRTSAAKELGIVQRSPTVADAELELQVLNHLRDLGDNEDDGDDFNFPLGIPSDDIMETEFGGNAVQKQLVPGRSKGRGDDEDRKLGKAPSSSLVGYVESAASSSREAASREVATCVASAAHVPSASAVPLGVREGLGSVEADGFGFENEGYVIESESEDSDCGVGHI